jgi:hypothetical protein
VVADATTFHGVWVSNLSRYPLSAIFPNTFTYFEPFMVKNALDKTTLDEGLL